MPLNAGLVCMVSAGMQAMRQFMLRFGQQK